MITTAIPIKGTFENITLPVAKQVTNRILSDLAVKGLFENKITYNSAYTGNSTTTTEDQNATLRDDKLSVFVSHNMNPLTAKWDMATFAHVFGGRLGDNKQKMPIFFDKESRVSITEKDVPFNVIMDFTMVVMDRVAAESIVDRIFSNFSSGQKMSVQDLRYEYPVPLGTLARLIGIYKLKTPSLEGFYANLREKSNNIFGTRESAYSTQKEFIIQHNVGQAAMAIEYDEERPDPQGTGKFSSSYEIKFRCTVQFGRPKDQIISYPIVCYNQYVPQDLLNVGKEEAYSVMRRHPYFSLQKYYEARKNKVVPEDVVRSPWYDKWSVPEGHPLHLREFKPFLTCVFFIDDVDNENGVTVLDVDADLTAIGITMIPSVLKYIKLQGRKTLSFDSEINITFYQDDVIISSDVISMDGTKFTIPCRDTKVTYRMVVSENRQFGFGVIKALSDPVYEEEVDTDTYGQIEDPLDAVAGTVIVPPEDETIIETDEDLDRQKDVQDKRSEVNGVWDSTRVIITEFNK